jgi:hypothetical protein
MAKKSCINCSFQYMCLLDDAFFELTQKPCFASAFETTNIKMIKETEIRAIIADGCKIYAERIE